MNRREAIAALVAMPEIARIERATLQPDDVLVVSSASALSSDAIAAIERGVRAVWPGRRVLVLDEGLTLRTVAG